MPPDRFLPAGGLCVSDRSWMVVEPVASRARRDAVISRAQLHIAVAQVDAVETMSSEPSAVEQHPA